MSDSIGIDIGSYAIKVAVGERHGKQLGIDLFASEYNPIGMVLPVDKNAQLKLTETLKKLVVEHKLSGKRAYLSLPESLAYTSVVSMPYLSEAELASSINWEAEQHIPVPLNEINLEYSVLYKPPKNSSGEKMRVLLVGARKEIVAKLVDMAASVGLEMVGLETGLLSIQRALTPVIEQSDSVMVCHIGALSTDVLISFHNELVLTYTTQVGGLAFTRVLERGLELQPQQAEEYKRSCGLDARQFDGKVRQVLLPIVNVLVSELRKAIQYYQASHMATPIRVMILTGGGAYLPGLTTFFAETFGIEVVVANPIDGVQVIAKIKEPIDVASYAVAIGLAAQQ